MMCYAAVLTPLMLMMMMIENDDVVDDNCNNLQERIVG